MPPPRTANGHRAYEEGHIRRLAIVRRARELGFSIEQIRTLLALAEPTRASCAEVQEVAQTHLDEVRAKLADLAKLERILAETVARCSGDPAPSCPVLDILRRRNAHKSDLYDGAAKPRGTTMTPTDRQAHWENIYMTKGEAEVSWFEETSTESLRLLQLVGAQPSSAIIDVGGGTSRLVDNFWRRASKTSPSWICRPLHSLRHALDSAPKARR